MFKVLKNEKMNFYWTIASALVFLFLVLIHFTIEAKRTPVSMEIDGAAINDSIVFEILKVEENYDYFIIEGYAYDPQRIIQYYNYVSGFGESYPVNSSIFIKDEEGVLVFYTSPISIQGIFDKNGKSVHYTGFHAKVKKAEVQSNWDGSIGVLIDYEGELSYTIRRLVISHE